MIAEKLGKIGLPQDRGHRLGQPGRDRRRGRVGRQVHRKIDFDGGLMVVPPRRRLAHERAPAGRRIDQPPPPRLAISPRDGRQVEVECRGQRPVRRQAVARLERARCHSRSQRIGERQVDRAAGLLQVRKPRHRCGDSSTWGALPHSITRNRHHHRKARSYTVLKQWFWKLPSQRRVPQSRHYGYCMDCMSLSSRRLGLIMRREAAFLGLVDVLRTDQPAFERAQQGEAGEHQQRQRGQQMNPDRRPRMPVPAMRQSPRSEN